MITIADIDLSEGEFLSEDEIDIAEGFLTVQASWTDLNGDFEIIPLQTNVTAGSYDSIYDFAGKPIRYKVEHRDVASGSKTFNLLDLNALAAMIKVRPIGGKYGATAGTVTLVIMNAAI